MTELQNPQRIDRAILSKTQEGAPIVSLFVEPLEFEALRLFESQFGELLKCGIDPNTMRPGQSVYTDFLAHWQEIERTNKNGTPYKRITHLEPGSAPQGGQAEIMGELRAIKALLMTLVDVDVDDQTAVSRQAVGPQAQPDERQPLGFHTGSYKPGQLVAVAGNERTVTGTLRHVAGDFCSVEVDGQLYTVAASRLTPAS
jgi:hypothetical protein